MLRKLSRWLGLLGLLAVVVACGGPRAGAKKRRKVRMPCPCNLHPHFLVYLAYANQEECKSRIGSEWAYDSHDGSKRLCCWTDK